MQLKLSWFRSLFNARNASAWFAFALFVGYGVLGAIAFWESQNVFFLELVFLTIPAVFSVILFSKIRLTVWSIPALRLIRNRDNYPLIVFFLFSGFALLVVTTAESVPLFAWMAGADQDKLVLLREKFLKARGGWQAAFPYINSVLTGSLMPYCLASLFLKNAHARWLVFAGFFLYCVLFIEKIFFIRAVIPILYVIFFVRRSHLVYLALALSGCFLLLCFLIVVSGFGGTTGVTDVPYFSNQFRPSGTLNYLFWRALAVPIFTAADSLALFSEGFNSVPLLGRTSSLLAKIFGQDRINFEQLVFNYQWGQTETGTGSANAVYIVDAYINFGWVGLFVYSAIIGILFRKIYKSYDQALHAIWPLFAFSLYVSGLVGTLASGGFLVVFLVSRLTRYPKASAKTKMPNSYDLTSIKSST